MAGIPQLVFDRSDEALVSLNVRVRAALWRRDVTMTIPSRFCKRPQQAIRTFAMRGHAFDQEFISAKIGTHWTPSVGVWCTGLDALEQREAILILQAVGA